MKTKESEIEVIIKMPFEDAKERKVKEDYRTYRNFVDGNIEMIPFPGMENVSIILNEEGKLFSMEPNLYSPEYRDVLVGPIMFVGTDGERMRSLVKDEMETIFSYIKQNDIRYGFEKMFGEQAQREM